MITSEIDNGIKCLLCIGKFLCLAFKSSDGSPHVCVHFVGTNQDHRAHCGRLTKTTASQAKTSTLRKTPSQRSILQGIICIICITFAIFDELLL